MGWFGEGMQNFSRWKGGEEGHGQIEKEEVNVWFLSKSQWDQKSP